MVNHYKAFRYFAYTIEILTIFVINETPGLIPELFGARPVLLIPVAISIAMFESEVAGMAFGLFCGLLIDFGIGNTLGFHGLLLSVTCYALSLMVINLLQTNLITALLVSLIVLTSIFLLQWVFFYVLFGYDHVIFALVNRYFPRLIYTFVFVPIAFYFNRAFAVLIKPRET